MSKLKIYQYNKCGTCRKAMKYLDSKGVQYQSIAIRETPPTLEELHTMLDLYQGDIRKLFNTSGQDYRNGNYKEKLPGMTEKQALQALAANGNLIKRPFLIGNGFAKVGFKEEEWDSLPLAN